MSDEGLTYIEGDWETREVYLNGHHLDPRPSQKVWNHSPDGFSWGYQGSGPAQLALAILMRFTDKTTAAILHQDFKREVIAPLPQDDFSVYYPVREWIEKNLARLDNDEE